MFATTDVLLFGAIAGVLAALANYALPWARPRWRWLIAGVATFLGFTAWNLVISHANAAGLDIDAPVVALSWQDVGSGVLAFATTALALGLAERHEPAFETTKAAALAGVVAMVFDIFVL